MDKTALREQQARLQKKQDQEIKVDYTNPEKARADMDKKIKEYYSNSARELMIVLKCYTDAGFTRTEAFEIVKELVSTMDA